jgi:hypothetical protein
VEAVPQACGHPRWLALQSVESDTVLCELCEMRQQRDDAVLMEQELQETVKQLSRALAEAVDGPTHMGEPVLPYRSKHGECAACEERFQALQARLSEEKAALATPAPVAQQPAELSRDEIEACVEIAARMEAMPIRPELSDERIVELWREWATSGKTSTITVFARSVLAEWDAGVAVYLKERETVTECLARNQADVVSALGLLADARQELAALKAQADVAQQPAELTDAARYRWLRDGRGVNWDVLPVDKGTDLADWRCMFHSPYGMHDESEDSLDAAIDAAIKAQGGRQ